MILRSALFLLLLSAMALAQSSAPQAQAPNTPPAQQPAAPAQHQHQPSPATPAAPGSEGQSTEPAKEKPVAPAAPVITLNGFCEAPAAGAAKPAAAASSNCKKVITKAEFEKIMEAVVPKNRRTEGELNPQMKQAIGRQYAEILVMANEAKKRGIQRRPNTQELLRISQLQVLAQGLLQELSEMAKPTPAEVDKYYNDNKAAFEEAIVRRLYIPKETPPAPPPAASGSEAKPAQQPATPAPDPAAQKAFAEKIRGRAGAGEDFDKLQAEAFQFAKNTQTPPTTQLGPRRRGTLPPDHDAAVFGLKAGEVSQWFETPTGSYLYKVESKRMLPLTEVREEISRRLQPQKFNDARTAISSSVKPEFNADYFGTAGVSPASDRRELEGKPAPAPKAQAAPGGPRVPRGGPRSTPAQPPTSPEGSQPK